MSTTSRWVRLSSCGGCVAALFVGITPWLGSTRVDAQRRGGASAAQPAASAMPRIVPGGIRIVGPGIGENAIELQAFNERPGTTIVLFITAPAHAGLVEIDEHASTVTAFADYKGQNLLEEASFGPFPKVSKDGSVGLAEVGVHARPSAGATALSVEGTIAVTLANGSKPQQIPNVRLEVGQTMKLGTTTITIKTVEVSGDSTTITLGIARQAMNAIRDVRFLTAQGAPMESRSAGSGYMNDAGQFDYEVKTTAGRV
jgi:hypothetical protein